MLGFSNGHDVDLDKLIKLLEENHDLLQEIVINEESDSSSALSKVLLDLINQINDKKEPLEEATKSDEELTGTHALHEEFLKRDESLCISSISSVEQKKVFENF